MDVGALFATFALFSVIAFVACWRMTSPSGIERAAQRERERRRVRVVLSDHKRPRYRRQRPRR